MSEEKFDREMEELTAEAGYTPSSIRAAGVLSGVGTRGSLGASAIGLGVMGVMNGRRAKQAGLPMGRFMAVVVADDAVLFWSERSLRGRRRPLGEIPRSHVVDARLAPGPKRTRTVRVTFDLADGRSAEFEAMAKGARADQVVDALAVGDARREAGPV